MPRSVRVGMTLLGALALLPATGCYGPFAATARLWHWNRHFEDEWTREAVFLATGVLTPVYALTTFADALLFNTVWFWSGEGWIDEPGGGHHLQAKASLPADPALDGLIVVVPTPAR